MEYNKKDDGSFEPLAQKNVDTGMGLERVAFILQGKQSVFDTELFAPIFQKLEELSSKSLQQHEQSFRVIADHMRASTFLLGDERDVTPSNVDQGYILRRFLRRSVRHGRILEIHEPFLQKIAQVIIENYKDVYPLLDKKRAFILDEIEKEEIKFMKTLETGLREFTRVSEKLAEFNQTVVSGKTAFLLFQSYGFPLEMTQELAHEKELTVDVEGFDKEYTKHKAKSKEGAEQKFKGGLADDGERTVRLHTATHLLNEALRKIIDKDIVQKGSNITSERLRFDFNFDRKLTTEEVQAVEDEVNRVIAEDIVVERYETSPDEAKATGAQSEFGARYPDKVSVYKIGDYSLEICMGPHVESTGKIGKFKIKKEESSAAGVRRIKAIVE